MHGCSFIHYTYTSQISDYSAISECVSADLVIDGSVHGVQWVNVSVQNPPPADCPSYTYSDFRIVLPPVINSAEPNAICTHLGAVNVTLYGSDFLVIDGVLPNVELLGDPTLVVSLEAQDCTILPMIVRLRFCVYARMHVYVYACAIVHVCVCLCACIRVRAFVCLCFHLPVRLFSSVRICTLSCTRTRHLCVNVCNAMCM